MGKDIFSRVALGTNDVALLRKISLDLPILADLCRSDLYLCCRAPKDKAIIVAQARPHSSSPLHEEDRVGEYLTADTHAEVLRALKGSLWPHEVHSVEVRGIGVARQIFPVWNDRRRLVAVLVKDAYWLAYERHRRRSKAFQEALLDFVAYVLKGELQGAADLTPFGEHDGIMLVGVDLRVRYMSGIASELFRQLGYPDSLIGRRVTEIETVDPELAIRAMDEKRCSELQAEHDGLTWVRKALPILSSERPFFIPRPWSRWRGRQGRPATRVLGAFILLHDATEALRTQQELESKMAMIREVHHRVKNNLQIVASIMRLQARRAQSEEARAVLNEAVNRVLSVAVVHEFLSRNAQGLINLEEIAQRIASQIQNGLIGPDKHITLRVSGPDIWLPAERATQCALVINELVQNAIEHGLVDRDRGCVAVTLSDLGEKVDIKVIDDGVGLPQGFDVEAHANLGLRIVHSMVSRDLGGDFTLENTMPSGTCATVRFDKTIRA